MKRTGFFLFASAIFISISAIKGTFVSYPTEPLPPTYYCPPPIVVNVCDPNGNNNNCYYAPCDPQNSVSSCGYMNGYCKTFTCETDLYNYNCQYNTKVQPVSPTYCIGLRPGDNFTPCNNMPVTDL